MKLIVLGSPGVGKGTYTQVLVKKLNIVHISTGEMFRQLAQEGNPLGVKAKEKYWSQGKLVPDEVVISLVKERLSQKDCRKGFILDGFPRTIAQAEALQNIVNIDQVLLFKADDEVIISRISGRMTCKDCGRIYHVKNLNPKVEGVCDSCGGEVIKRSDDNPTAVKDRLNEYREKTAPLINYYKKKSLLSELLINEDFGTHGEIIIARIMKVLGRSQSESENLKQKNLKREIKR